MINRLKKFLNDLFSGSEKDDISIGIYGPPNAGKSTLANHISQDLSGEEMSDVSEVPHESPRAVEKKEKLLLNQMTDAHST
ncbi:hypothetical protein HRED_03232 [Candidatus Haloredivivus sp. G17]|nr:hypothetical protein HRED_03232 [Candidatus Haloredivivus sp. G17]